MRELLTVDLADAAQVGDLRISPAEVLVGINWMFPPGATKPELGGVHGTYSVGYRFRSRDVAVVLTGIEFDAKIARPDLDLIRANGSGGADAEAVPGLRDAVARRTMVPDSGGGYEPVEALSFVSERRIYTVLALKEGAGPGMTPSSPPVPWSTTW